MCEKFDEADREEKARGSLLWGWMYSDDEDDLLSALVL